MSAPPNAMAAMMNPPPGPRLAEDGEWVNIPESDDTIIDTPDGGADIILEQQSKKIPTADEDDFYENLVNVLPEDYLESMVTDLIDKIERDKQTRTRRDEQYAEGLRRTGLGKEAPGGAEFEGASRAVHPMLTKASVDFAARAMKEIFPAQGPAKSFIPGTVTKERTDKANRLTRYYNWLMTTQMLEFRPGLEQTFTQSALGGVQYMRFRWDQRMRRQVSNVVAVDQLFLPYDAASLWAAERITYQDDITELEYRNRVRDGIYRDVDAVPPSMRPEESKSAEARAKLEGKEPDVFNTDGTRRTYEVSTYFDDLEQQLGGGPVDADVADSRALPYLIFLDESSRKVAGVFRNWERDDDKMQRMHWIVEWPFIPWTGAYPIGMIHCIGSLSGSATGILRALIDAGHIGNFQTTYVLKGANVGGQSQQVKPTQQNYVKGGVGGDDIRKLLMPVQPQQPSLTLFQLLGFLVEQAEGMVQTAFENLSENNPNAPVGTTYALIEQGLAVVSSIIGRMHYAMFHTLQVIHRISRMYVTDDEIRDEAGEVLAYRSDFQGPSDVIPVSDPGIPSDAHRFAQMQVVAQRADLKPMLYNQRRVEKMILERLRISDPDSFLMPLAEPEEMNAANENAAASLGKPIVAYPHQDHLAHIKTHIDYMNNPLLGSLPLLAPKVLPPMLDHLSQHVALWYLGRIYHTVKTNLDGELEEYMEITDEKVKSEIDRTIAAASDTVNQEAQKVFASIPAVVQRAQALLKSLMPPPQDPNVQVQMARIQSDDKNKAAALQQKDGIDKANISQKANESNLRLVNSREQRQSDTGASNLQQASENQRHQTSTQSDAAIAALHEMEQNARQEQSDTTKQQVVNAQNATKQAINDADNQTALTISQKEIDAGKHSPLSTGRGLSSQGRGVSE
jgi:hypothetical protein